MPSHPALHKTRYLRLALTVLVLVASALEGRYGQPELYGDDISYLDVVNMIRLGDWKAALNPLWSIGYPMLLTVVRTLFPADIHGELRAVFWLNMAISIAAYFAFLWLVREIFQYHRIHTGSDQTQANLSPLTLVASTFAFLTAAIGCARISSIGPDLLVAALFFAATALLLRILQRSTASRAAALGVILGIGYLAKAFFLPLAAIFLAILVFTCIRKRRYVPIAIAAVCWLVCVIPYASGLSWAFGRITLGESAALNYAFHVNGLPHWMGWQGDAQGHGTPVHPVQLLSKNPPVFAFGEPFHVTYPPQYNMPYFYDGYRHYTVIHNAVMAFLTNLHSTAGVLVHNIGFVLAVLLCALIAYRQRDKRTWTHGLLSTWPWVVPALLGILLYEQVHLEARYIAGFVAVLAILPFLAIDLWSKDLQPRLCNVMLLLVVVGGSADLLIQLREPIVLAAHLAPVQTEGQWRIARFLTTSGLHPGDKVAVVSNGNDIRCAWAYGARVHVVAAIGNDAYDPAWQDQLRDLHLFFDDPKTQRDTLARFRQQGAVAVIAPNLPFTTNDAGWQQVPNTSAWVLLLH